MPRYGNTSVSALLSQARAALKKQQAYEEEIASYEYDLSPKDQESYDKYASFLTKRAKEVQSTDPAKALSLTRKITGANRSFTSSEIQRQSISVLEGTGSKQQKLQVMINLYRRALENGDEATAQRLQLQADTLQQSIFADEQAKAGSGGGGGGGSSESAYAKGYDEALKPLKALIKEAKAGYESGKLTRAEYIKTVSTAYSGTQDRPGISQLYEQASKDENLSDSKRYTYQNEFNSLGGSNAILKDLHEAQQNLKGTPTSIRYIDENGQIGTKELKTTGDSLGLNLYGNNIVQKTDLSSVLKDNGKYKAGITGRTVETDPLTGAPVYRNEAGDKVEKGTPGAILSTSTPENTAAATFDLGNGVRSRMLFSPVTGEAQEFKQYTNEGNKTTNQLNPDRLYVTRDKNGNPLNTEQDFGENSLLPGWNFNLVDNAKQYLDPNFYKQGAETATEAYKVLEKAKGNKLVDSILSFGGNLTGGVGNSLRTFGNFAELTKQVGVLKQRAEAKKQAEAEAARAQEAALRANQAAIQQANAATAARAAQASRGLPVITPTINKPTPQAQVIGSKDFNSTYLGGFGNLLNKYLR